LHVLVEEGSVRYDDGREVRTVRAGADPFVRQARAFLRAVRSGDPGELICDLEDALRSHRLTHDVLDATRA